MKDIVYLDNKKYGKKFNELFKKIFNNYITVDSNNVIGIANKIRNTLKYNRVNIYKLYQYNTSSTISINKDDRSGEFMEVSLSYKEVDICEGEFDFDTQEFKKHDRSSTKYRLSISHEHFAMHSSFYTSKRIYVDDKCVILGRTLFCVEGKEMELDENIKAIFIDPLKEDGEI